LKNAAGIRLVTAEQKEQRKLEFAANTEKEQERVKSAEKRASEILEQATEKNLQGLERIRYELRQNIAEYGLTKKAIQDLKAAAGLEGVSLLRKEAIDALKDYGKEVERQNDTFFKIRADQAPNTERIMQRRFPPHYRETGMSWTPSQRKKSARSNSVVIVRLQQ